MPSTARTAGTASPVQKSIDRKTARRILIADPHRLVAEALAERFRRERWAEVVGVATSHSGAVSQAAKGKPHVMLLEVGFDGSGAADLCKEVASRSPDVRFVFLSSNTSEVALKIALDLSAGYLLKTEPLEDVVSAIGAMSGDAPPFSREVAKRIRSDEQSNGFVLKHPTAVSDLTPRQIEVLRRIAWGSTSREIARALGITTKGVESHKHRIMHKLKVYDRMALARLAFREGIVLL